MQESFPLHGLARHMTRNRPGSVTRILLLPILLLQFSCAKPARYIIITEDAKDIRTENTGQFIICLTKEDARRNSDILELRTRSDIKEYQKKRTDSRNPVEDVLYQLIREDYSRAETLLNQYGSSLPIYLRLAVRADLAAEGADRFHPTEELIKLYQEAFDVPGCDINRELIRFRIRQLRYRR